MMADLDPASGEPRWERELGSDWISSLCSPAVADGVIVMGGVWQGFGGNRGHSLVALALDSGEVVWTARSEGFHASPAIADGRVYTVDITGKFRVLDLHTGAELWGAGLFDGWATTTPAIDTESGTLVTGTADGVVHAFDVSEQRKTWTFATGLSRFRMSSYQGEFLSVLGSPTICGDAVFIGSADGRLRQLDLRTGQERWLHDFGVPMLTAPCPSGDLLLVGSLDGSLTCLRSGSGATQGHDHAH